ncbi:MAG: LexA family transcriptional regulator [Alphaproteobacteria bacterium]|nr:LexA family transcriptional regulator [Alphaproteobacteria bacterium]
MPCSLQHIITGLLESVEKSGRSDREISLAAVGHESAIRSLRRGHDPRLSTLLALSQELEFSIEFLTKGDIVLPDTCEEVPLLGEIAAGGSDGHDDGQVMTYAQNNRESTIAPVGLNADDLSCHGALAAMRVRGESMQPMYQDGDYVYVYGKDPLRYTPDRLIGRDCAIVIDGQGGMDDGAIYLKRLRRADNGERDMFNLESLNPHFPTMTNIAVHNVMPVRHVRRSF